MRYETMTEDNKDSDEEETFIKSLIPIELFGTAQRSIELNAEIELFKNWIKNRKRIAPKTKEIMLYCLNNLEFSFTQVKEGMGLNSDRQLNDSLNKLTGYAERYNEFGIYEFLVKKYYPSYFTPRKLMQLAVKRLKTKEIITTRKQSLREITKSINAVFAGME